MEIGKIMIHVPTGVKVILTGGGNPDNDVVECRWFGNLNTYTNFNRNELVPYEEFIKMEFERIYGSDKEEDDG